MAYDENAMNTMEMAIAIAKGLNMPENCHQYNNPLN